MAEQISVRRNSRPILVRTLTDIRNQAAPSTVVDIQKQSCVAQTGRMVVEYGYVDEGIGAMDQKMDMKIRFATMPSSMAAMAATI